jgi:hypothetical protein
MNGVGKTQKGVSKKEIIRAGKGDDLQRKGNGSQAQSGKKQQQAEFFCQEKQRSCIISRIYGESRVSPPARRMTNCISNYPN